MDLLNNQEIRLPYHRVYRPLVDDVNSVCYENDYLNDKDYAQKPQAYTRAFMYLQQDIKSLFEYVEPADVNLNTYSYRIHQLLVRVCIEVEANFKAILRENGYTKIVDGKVKEEKRWDILDYKKVDKSHRLHDYMVIFPEWNGANNMFVPFKEWNEGEDSLTWYRAYNATKHNREIDMKQANLENLLLAFSGLFVLLSCQFGTDSYAPRPGRFIVSRDFPYYVDFIFGIGDYLGIKFPIWEESEKYNFVWNNIKDLPDKFQMFDYNMV